MGITPAATSVVQGCTETCVRGSFLVCFKCHGCKQKADCCCLLNLLQYIDWMTDKGQDSGVFLQWKPVCYTAWKRDMQSSMKTAYYPLVRYNITSENADINGLVFAYFGLWKVHSQASNVSFGGAGDDIYYNGTAYITWSVTNYSSSDSIFCQVTCQNERGPRCVHKTCEGSEAKALVSAHVVESAVSFRIERPKRYG